MSHINMKTKSLQLHYQFSDSTKVHGDPLTVKEVADIPSTSLDTLTRRLKDQGYFEWHERDSCCVIIVQKASSERSHKHAHTTLDALGVCLIKYDLTFLQ